MKRWSLHCTLTLLGVLLASVVALGCDELPAGTNFWIRLTKPVSTFSAHRGDRLSSILADTVECGDEVIFPAGSQLQGSVLAVRKVGLGVRHETASLEITFTLISATPSSRIHIQTRVAEVENARERVKNGVIEGIRSTDTPQGRINSRLSHMPTWNPYSDGFLLAFKVGFPIFPEPEIYYGPGTDLRLVLSAPLVSPPVAKDVPEVSAFSEEERADLTQLVASMPERSTTTANVDADLVNLVFLASREQVGAAFRAAEWSPNDSVSPRSFLSNFYAFLDDDSYAQAPMRTLLLNGARSDMNWQKSLNSCAKRDHLRMWQSKQSWNHEPVWVSTATQDTSATLSVRHHGFVHHIAADLDAERARVLRDLNLAGCIRRMDYVQRPELAHFAVNAIGDRMRTDGDVAVVQLQECTDLSRATPTIFPAAHFHAGSRFFRFARRQILTFRSDIWRANIIYGMYELGTMTFAGLRKRSDSIPSVDAGQTFTSTRRTVLAIARPRGESPEAAPNPTAETGYVGSAFEK